MLGKIVEALDEIEQEHDVRIIYACESGSRAWGFASGNSDYDIRFIYARPLDWYLQYDVENKRDVIEKTSGILDVSGWDIRKACGLLMRSNGALIEWLHSPIVYRETMFSSELKALTRYTNPKALCWHYYHMAKRHDARYLVMFKVLAKKALYALRSVLAVRYIEKYNSPPPVLFDRLISCSAPSELALPIKHLQGMKRKGNEQSVIDLDILIRHFLDSELERMSNGFNCEGDRYTMSEVKYRVNGLFYAVAMSG